ncbi:MAG: Ig-like domain-containing protein, partial [Anaerolineales bacterium]
SAASIAATCDLPNHGPESMTDTVNYATEGAVAVLAMNRPDSLNGFTAGLCGDLLECFERADADDDTGVEKVVFYLDDALTFTDYSPPYEWQFLSGDAENGNHTLEAKAIDLSGRSAIDSLGIEIANLVDLTGPQVTIISPLPNTPIDGTVSVVAALTDDAGLGDAILYLDNVEQDVVRFSASTLTEEAHFSLDTIGKQNGPHQLKVLAYDLEGRTGQDTVDVVVDNPPPPAQPHLEIPGQRV